jgi:hypothetical protein
MGYNTTVLVLNDALDEIENDAEFGGWLAVAVRTLNISLFERVDVSSGQAAVDGELVSNSESRS